MGFGENLRKAFDAFSTLKVVDKESVKTLTKELQRALISADVDIETVLSLSKQLESAALAETIPKGLTRKEHLISLTYDALVDVLGGKTIAAPEKPTSILLVGLFGSGKTTTCAKLAHYYGKRGLRVGIIAADTFRPAAVDQLEQLVKQLPGVQFYSNRNEKEASVVVRQGIVDLMSKGVHTIIVDSAGRSALDPELVDEVKRIHAILKPENVWLVLGGDVGQQAKKQASAFHDAVGVNGVVLTRMDGSAKGGGALSACRATHSPVYFIGMGEKINDLEAFHADRFLSRVMGYGDLKGLLEKMEDLKIENINTENPLEGPFTLQTFYTQLESTRKMGSLSKIAEMLGFGMNIPKHELEVGEEKLDKYKSMMDSMTKQEKRDPEVLTTSRIERIAKGSGTNESDVRDLLKHYRQLKKMMGQFKNLDEEKLKNPKGMQKLMKGFQKPKKIKLR
ncbi:MAG: signal recognition particle protein [Candidatus Diapherotrites archaeon]|uniref:Signal recognition particle 54 kDa protein n=1 Tax=Candidatus Iainarchaeum sp. TaxID=3101447 RepID=A0A8T4C8Y7_9ARCH|nr:signal recognition particle protein [Candidatus Diapherotrites archaeon]